LTILATALTLFAFLKPKQPAANPPRNGFARAAIAAAGLVAAAAAVETLGLIVSFGLLSFFLVYAIERRSFVAALTVAAAFAMSFLALFRLILQSPLPVGPWGF
jgi:hypothetical protein